MTPGRIEDVAAAYDAIHRRAPLADSPAFYRWILRLARPKPGAALLDIGCGTGGALRAALAAGMRPTGVEISSVALDHARRAAPGARLVRADGARLPFADRSFRHLFNLGNLEHFVDLAAGVREMRRVLTDDGRAWILLPNLYYSGTIWRVIVRGGPGPDHHQPIDRFATRSEWQAILQAGGLRVVRSRPYHRGKWWKRLLPTNLAWHFLFEVARGEPQHCEALLPLGRTRRTSFHSQV